MSAWTPHLYHSVHGNRAVLVAEGRAKLGILIIDTPVRILRVEKTEGRYLRDLTYHGAPYPLARAVKRFRRSGRRLGITKGARKVLRQLKGETA